MSDPDLLRFLYDRLIQVHGEKPNYDYMLRLEAIITRLRNLEMVMEELRRLAKP